MIIPLSLIIIVIYIITSSAPVSRVSAAGLYVFGDSFVDSGNNNSLNTTAKCNHPPYGINFDSNRTATGRWTDGLIITDYIASFMGLPYPPNFQDIVKSNEDVPSTGANFACASAGILNFTGFGGIRTFEDQITDFGQLRLMMMQQMGDLEALRAISRSIFYINIGTNDVANVFRVSQQQVSSGYQELLLRVLSHQLLQLYAWGARKFVVVSAAIIGCPPLELRQAPCYPLGESSARSFNAELFSMTRNMSIANFGMSIVYANLHDLMMEVIHQPELHGFVNANDPCCPLSGATWCSYTDVYCSSPSEYMFWDIAHPSNAFNKLAARRFWNGSLIDSFPVNIRQLASMW